MASEDAGDLAGVTVSGDVRRWFEERAVELGIDEECFVRELLAAHYELDSEGVALDAEDADGPTIADESDLEALRSEFQELIEDVRSRVVQVKREADGKAPVEHDHEAIEDDLGDLRDELATLSEELGDHQNTLESLQSSVDDGFENFEDVLEYLLQTTDDLAERTDRLARASIGTRERLGELAGSIEARDAADRLKRDAVLEGVSSAECQECGQSIRAAMLTAPECPFCAATIVDVEPKHGLFGSATFVTGDRPALVGTDDDPVAEELEADVERERPDPADVDWDTAGDDDA